MQYIILKITNIPVDREFIASELANLIPTEGIWELEGEWQIYFKKQRFEQDSQKIINEIKNYFGQDITIKIEDFNDDGIDWNEEWKKNYKPVYIGDHVVIYPSWFDITPEDQEKTIIKIDPQMGFGTGTHETTQLMIEQITRFVVPDSKILDMGTGSGILAILCEKLCPTSKITAIEIDEDALENAILNGRLNQCKRIEWILGGKDRIPEQLFDLILANINRSVLLTMIPEFQRHLSENGKMILSGILAEEKQLIIEACTMNHLELLVEDQKNEWVVQVWQPQQ